MKKEYENPVIEIEIIDNSDIVTSSSTYNEELFGKNADEWTWGN